MYKFVCRFYDAIVDVVLYIFGLIKGKRCFSSNFLFYKYCYSSFVVLDCLFSCVSIYCDVFTCSCFSEDYYLMFIGKFLDPVDHFLLFFLRVDAAYIVCQYIYLNLLRLLYFLYAYASDSFAKNLISFLSSILFSKFNVSIWVYPQ